MVRPAGDLPITMPIIAVSGAQGPRTIERHAGGLQAAGLTMITADPVAGAGDIALFSGMTPPSPSWLADACRFRLPAVALLAVDNDGEASLLDAGLSLCLTPAVTTAELAVWLRHLLRLAGRAWPDGFSFDPASRSASFQCVRLTLPPASFDLLFDLARHAGRIRRPAELDRALWPGRPGSRARLAATIHHLRRALAAAGAEGCLETVAGGYRLRL